MQIKRITLILSLFFLFKVSFLKAQNNVLNNTTSLNEKKTIIYSSGTWLQSSFYLDNNYLLTKIKSLEKYEIKEITTELNVNLIDKLYIHNHGLRTYETKVNEDYYLKYSNLSELYITNMTTTPFDINYFKKLNTLYVFHANDKFGVRPRISNFQLNQITELKELKHLVIATQKVYKIPEKLSLLDSLKIFYISSNERSPFLPLGLLLKDVLVCEEPNKNLFLRHGQNKIFTPEIYAFYSVGILDVKYAYQKNEIEFLASILNTNQKHNSRNGKFSLNYKNGEKLTTGKFKNGKPVGEWKFYYPNGKLYSVRNYNNGIENGTWYKFTETGDTALVLRFNNGSLEYSLEKSDDIYNKKKYSTLEVLEYENETPKKLKFSLYYDKFNNRKIELIFHETYLTPYENLDDFLLLIVKVNNYDISNNYYFPFDFKMDYEFRFWDKEGQLVHDLKYKKGVLQN